MAKRLNSYDFLKKCLKKLLFVRVASPVYPMMSGDYFIVLDVYMQNQETSFESVEFKVLTKHGISVKRINTNTRWFIECWPKDDFEIVE